MMAVLQETEIRQRLESMSGWTFDGSALVRAFTFSDYLAGIRFVERLAREAERNNHHPDLEVGYGKVVVRWSTHSAGGVTGRDFRLAALTDTL